MSFVALKCPGCGSDIQLDDSREFGFCNYCGTKVMQDKIVVEHQGQVKIDNSDYVAKFLQNARRAKQKEDWKETEKYYNLVEQNDPTNIEAIFYSSFAQVKLALLEKDSKEKRQNIFNILVKGVSVIDDNYDNTNKEHEKLLFEIMDDINGLKKGTIVPTTHLAEYVTKNGYGNIVDRNQIVEDDFLSVTYNMIDDVFVAYMDSLANIIVAHSPEPVKKLFVENVNSLSMNSEIHEKVEPYIDGYKTPKQASVEIAKQVIIDTQTTYADVTGQINELGKTICPIFMLGSELNSSLKTMVREKLRESYPDSKAVIGGGWGGCYVATAVYGSYNCPQVWTLRRYRDNTLAATWYGRAFIHTYYAVSPTLVKWFGHTDWFRNMWKPKLDKMVDSLHKQGVEDTPYNDKNW